MTEYYNQTSSDLNLTFPLGLYLPLATGSVFALGGYVDETSRATAIIDAIYNPPTNRTCALTTTLGRAEAEVQLGVSLHCV